MTRALPRTNFNSSELIRLLADLSIEDPAESRPAFAEKLGEWLGFADAITLSTSLGASTVIPSDVKSGRASVTSLALEKELARIRATLANSITTVCSSAAGELRMKLPAAQAGATVENIAITATYEPYRRIHLAQQREMEVAIRPLRALVRNALLQASPPLRQLATLDGAMDKILGERERTLLSTVCFLLEKRFGKLLATHQQKLMETRQTDSIALWIAPGGWLERFFKDWQAILLAELDVRLQPAVGLIEAFSNEAGRDK